MSKLTLFYTFIAMIAFAGNSVLCRLALSDNENDPIAFTLLRLISGAIVLMLWVVAVDRSKTNVFNSGSWQGGIALFGYAITFSLAYLYLDTATGALVLFATVQLSILLISLFKGERMTKVATIGLVFAFSGFLWLMLPGANQPNVEGLALMLLSGLSWAGYTIIGKYVKSPLIATQGNFLKATMLAFITLIWFIEFDGLTRAGVVLAIASGALASGAGYAIWYSAVKGLSHLSSGIVQLSVPVIAAIGGVLFVGEAISLELLIVSGIILGGIALVVHQSAPGK